MLIFIIFFFFFLFFSSWLNHISVGRHKPSIFTQSDILDKSKKMWLILGKLKTPVQLNLVPSESSKNSDSRTVKFGLQDGKFGLQDGIFGLQDGKIGLQDGKTGHFPIIKHSLLKNECDNKRKF